MMKKKKVNLAFMDKLGSIFDGTHGKAYFYNFFLLAKAIITAIILAAVFTPMTNSGLILAINAFDNFVLLFWHPNVSDNLISCRRFTAYHCVLSHNSRECCFSMILLMPMLYYSEWALT